MLQLTRIRRVRVLDGLRDLGVLCTIPAVFVAGQWILFFASTNNNIVLGQIGRGLSWGAGLAFVTTSAVLILAYYRKLNRVWPIHIIVTAVTALAVIALKPDGLHFWFLMAMLAGAWFSYWALKLIFGDLEVPGRWEP